MGLSIDEILMEADGVLEKRAAKNPKPEVSSEADAEVVKLANFLMQEDASLFEKQKPTVKIASSTSATPTMSNDQYLAEKIAEAFAITETMLNLEELRKEQLFIEKAAAAGHSEEAIEAFLEKRAAPKVKMPVGKILAGLGAGAAAGAAHHVGKKKGQQQGAAAGYTQALHDVDDAFKMYGQGQ